MGAYMDRKVEAVEDYWKLRVRNTRPSTEGISHEPMTERQFVRSFGTKVAKSRLSGRPDFVGLLVLGRNTGFWITRNGDERLCRLVDITDGKLTVTKRFIRCKHFDSLSNLQRGLLRYVQ